MKYNIVYNEDCLQGLKKLPDECIDCVVTSPPYYALRDYGCEGQIELEETPQAYIDSLTEIFMEIYRVLKPTGTLWINIGDTYNGNKMGNTETNKNKKVAERNEFKKKIWHGAKQKDLIGIPWMLAFSLRDRGWYLRQDIIWYKPNAMPESVKDRCTKSHEYIFLLTKSQKYYFDQEQIQEIATGYDGRKDVKYKGSTKYKDAHILPNNGVQSMAKNGHERWKFKNLQPKGQQPHSMHLRRASGQQDYIYPVRNKRDVWTVNTKPDKNAHFAVYPEKLIEPCILAGCPYDGVVLDPFMGSGTTARVAKHFGRKYIGFELNKEYLAIIKHKTIIEEDLFAR